MSACIALLAGDRGDIEANAVTFKKWQCIVCGFVYNEEEGYEADGIAPGTRWEDVPDDWLCPECGVGKADFDMIEIE